jgi:hypothetical protein
MLQLKILLSPLVPGSDDGIYKKGDMVMVSNSLIPAKLSVDTPIRR